MYAFTVKLLVFKQKSYFFLLSTIVSFRQKKFLFIFGKVSHVL